MLNCEYGELETILWGSWRPCTPSFVWIAFTDLGILYFCYIKHNLERSSFSGIEILKLKNPGMVFSLAFITVIGIFQNSIVTFLFRLLA